MTLPYEVQALNLCKAEKTFPCDRYCLEIISYQLKIRYERGDSNEFVVDCASKDYAGYTTEAQFLSATQHPALDYYVHYPGPLVLMFYLALIGLPLSWAYDRLGWGGIAVWAWRIVGGLILIVTWVPLGMAFKIYEGIVYGCWHITHCSHDISKRKKVLLE